MVTNYVQVGNLQVAEVLFQFINEQVLPNSGVEQTAFWDGFDKAGS